MRKLTDPGTVDWAKVQRLERWMKVLSTDGRLSPDEKTALYLCADVMLRLRARIDVLNGHLIHARKGVDEIERLRARDEQHYRSAKQTWQAIPDEFKLSPTDGGAIDERFAIADMAKEIERLRAHVEALQQKVDADKSCACAYDSPDDVCLPHSPVVERLRAENKRMRDAIPLAFANVDGEEVQPEAAIRDMTKTLARAQFNLQRVDALATALEATNANLTEALRLMEPVVASEAATQWPEVVCIERCDARAITGFVNTLKGAPQ